MHNIKLNNPILKRQSKVIVSVIVMVAFLLANLPWANGYGGSLSGADARWHSQPANLRPLAASERQEVGLDDLTPRPPTTVALPHQQVLREELFITIEQLKKHYIEKHREEVEEAEKGLKHIKTYGTQDMIKNAEKNLQGKKDKLAKAIENITQLESTMKGRNIREFIRALRSTGTAIRRELCVVWGPFPKEPHL